VVLVATGVGVGPFVSLATHLLGSGFDRTIRLFWGLRRAEDLCLTAELDRLASDHLNFEYHVSLSEPPGDWRGQQGRVTDTVPPALDDLSGTHFVLCGNGAMTEELGAALAQAGVDQRRILAIGSSRGQERLGTLTGCGGSQRGRPQPDPASTGRPCPFRGVPAQPAHRADGVVPLAPCQGRHLVRAWACRWG